MPPSPQPKLAEPPCNTLACVAALALLSAACMAAPARDAGSWSAAAQQPPASFALEGKPFCFAGSNNYYAIYKPKPMVDDLFDAAKKLDLQVMRIWGMLDRGSLDGKVPSVDGAGEKDGVYFQYWDDRQKRPAYNDGENGLQRLDYALAAAAARQLKLIVVLVNNWRAFGGIDQYLTWYGLEQHRQFFTAPEVKQAYRDWLAHVITRRNSVNGRLYRDDPTVFAWELANEPRCKGGGAFDVASGCDPRTLTGWADEMSSYLKSLDPNHLVSVGDEGFLNANGAHWAYRAADGVDHAALTALPAIDFGTFHLYPGDWGMTPELSERWISDHLRVARDLGKPSLLEEYGVRVTRAEGTRGDVTRGWARRRDSYQRWNDLLLERGGSAALPWMLAGNDDRGSRYPDYDQFAFYADDPTGRLLQGYAKRFANAPACRAQPTLTAPPSPFVRVIGSAAHAAWGWHD